HRRARVVAAPMTASQDLVTLQVEGMAHRGWKSVSITRGIKAMAGRFELDVSDKWEDSMAARTIRPQDTCQISIGQAPLITGYAEAVEASSAGRSQGLRISGRDKTGDLVDCAIEKRPAQWRNKKLEAIAQELAQPFGVQVIAGDDTGAPIEEAAA